MTIHLAGAETQESTWQFRVLSFLLRGNVLPRDITEEATAILLAVLQNNRNHFPRYAYKAYIDKDGMMTADFATGPKETQREARRQVGHVEHVREMFRTIADFLKLSDDDRIAMFTALRNWVATDDRAQADLDDGPNLKEV